MAIKKTEIEDAFYELGLALRELATKKMYTALGHASFAELLRARKVFGHSQAKKLIAIVSTIDRRTAIALGVEKAYAALRYTEATPEADTPEGLAARDPKIGGKRFSDLTATETLRRANALRAGAPPGDASGKPARGEAPAKIAELVERWARRAGAKDAKATARRRGGAWIVAIEIGLEAAAALAATERKPERRRAR